MPTYHYACSKCGQEFDAVQLISAKPLTVCPEELCKQKKWGKGKIKRLITAGAGIIFKGSGFYITDYRSEKYKEAAKKDAAPATSSANENKTPKSDTKPAAKASETKPSKPAGSKDS